MGRESESVSIDELCPTQSHISPRKRLVENPVNLNMGSQWRKPSAAYLRLKENLVLSRCFHRPNMLCGQLWSNILYLYKNSSSTQDTHRTKFAFPFPDSKRSFVDARTLPYLGRACPFALSWEIGLDGIPVSAYGTKDKLRNIHQGKKTLAGVRAREQPMKQTVGWHNRRRLDFQSRQPNASLSNLVLHQQGQPTCAARTLQHGQTDLPLGSHDRRIWPTPSAPPKGRGWALSSAKDLVDVLLTIRL